MKPMNLLKPLALVIWWAVLFVIMASYVQGQTPLTTTTANTATTLIPSDSIGVVTTTGALSWQSTPSCCCSCCCCQPQGALTLVANPIAWTADNVVLQKYAHAQQPPKPADVKPALYRLNPEASEVWLDIQAKKQNLADQYAVLESQQLALAVGAGVPPEIRAYFKAGLGWLKSKDGAIVFAVPEPTPTPK